MSTPTAEPPSPMPLMRMMTAFQQTMALKAASDLDLFTKLGEGATTAAALAQATGASARGVEILADYLVVAGVLAKTAGEYRMSPEAAMFLDRRSPASLAETLTWWGLALQREAGADLAATVRRGGAEEAIADPGVWVVFARSMAPLMRMPAEYVAEHIVDAGLAEGGTVLDIAGGHGLYGIAVAKRFPKAQVTLVDAAEVGAVARENAARAGVAARYQVRAGSALPGTPGEVEFGSGHKLVLITGFLHHFSEATIVRLLAKARASLAGGGTLLALDFVPNDDRVSPPFPAAFSLIMLAETAEGRAYTEAEYRRFMAAAGLRGFERRDLPGLPATAMMSRA